MPSGNGFGWTYSTSDIPTSEISSVGAPQSPDTTLPCDEALDPATLDMALPMVLIRGAAAVLQRIRIRFSIWLGDWFLNQNEGVPYEERILVAPPNLVVAKQVFSKLIESTPGVAALSVFDISFDGNTRTLAIKNMVITLVTGQTVTANTSTGFVI